MRDVVADVLSAQRGPLRADDPKWFDAAHPRISLPGALPVRCETRSEHGGAVTR
jgi:hypothetical protein